MKQQKLRFRHLAFVYARFLAVIVLLTSCGTSQSDSSSVRNQEQIESVVRFCLSDTTMVSRNSLVLDELGNTLAYPSDSLGLEYEWPKSLSKKDINHIFRQARDTSEIKLKDGLYTQKLIPADTIHHLLAMSKRFGLEYFWDEVHSRYGGGYSMICKPVFSEDYTIAIVTVSYHCGSLCGGGRTYILRKEGHEWVRDGIVSNWIS